MEYNKYLTKAFQSKNEFKVDYSIPTFKHFEDLDNLIHSGAKNIVLTSNYLLSYGETSKYSEGINLDVDDIVIDGNNHFINALEKTRIFNITGKNITIKNLIMKNGLNEDRAGAIYNNGEATIINSVLKNNRTYTYDFIDCRGGAIYNGNDGILNIINCKLSNNSSKDDGGAIYNLGDLTIKYSSIKQNEIIKGGGGAIFNDGELKIRRTRIIENRSRYGGAIFNNHSGMLNIKKTIINDNVARTSGAIYNLAKLNITDSIFSSNRAYGYYLAGGAIYTSDRSELNIKKSKFLQNKTTSGDGGAIAIRKAKVTTSESIFNKNESKVEGGAIMNYGGDLIIFKSIFDDNIAKGNGGAIKNSLESDMLIVESQLNNNVAEKQGGAVYSLEDIEIKDCSFNNNAPNNTFIENN